jgi:DNA-binding transcriptional LysR family regulator
VSQARISQTIKKLERQVGAPLFDRTSRRVALTPIGAALRDDLAPAYRQIVDGVARATDAGRGTGGVLRLGFEAPGVADLVADVLDAYRSQRPDGDVQVREADFRDPFGLLRSGEVDALVTLLPGICPLAAHARQYFAHPRITFVPFRDAPHVEWAVVWRRAGETERVHQLARVIRSRAG